MEALCNLFGIYVNNKNSTVVLHVLVYCLYALNYLPHTVNTLQEDVAKPVQDVGLTHSVVEHMTKVVEKVVVV